MEIGILIFLGFVLTVGLLIYRYEQPKSKRNKLTGRGGDFAE